MSIERGIGVAALGIGTGVALGFLQDVAKSSKKKKPIKLDFKPIKFKW